MIGLTLPLPQSNHEHAYYTGHAPAGNEGVVSYTSKKPLADAKSMLDRLVYEIDYDKLKK